jgi:hypothetical protein
VSSHLKVIQQQAVEEMDIGDAQMRQVKEFVDIRLFPT